MGRWTLDGVGKLTQAAMERVFTAHERPFAQIDFAALAITQLRADPGQRHIGILYRDETGEVVLLHLAWHYKLKSEPPESTYAWIRPLIPSRRSRQVAAFCRMVLKANPNGIPYAFSPASDSIDKQTGKFINRAGGCGLTCATFVLAVFDATGLPLAQYNTWPSNRQEDELWREHIIGLLERSGAEPEHIQNVRAERDAIRYRPEEVAGAAACTTIPARFNAACELAGQIVAKLQNAGCVT